MGWRGLLLGVLVFAAGCADDAAQRAAEQREFDERAGQLAEQLDQINHSASQELIVQLVFEDDVDLDLYVTGPLLETVYFANQQSESGGVIAADVRCDSSGPRIEKIAFEDPMPGKYRVGVDFPERCRGEGDVAPFAVSISHAGGNERAQGRVSLQHFEIVVLEFEIEGG